MILNPSDIESETPNQNGLKFVKFGNQIVNLDHVCYVDYLGESGNLGKPNARAVVIYFSNGKEIRQDFNNQVNSMACYSRLLYCIEKNLFDISLTGKAYERIAISAAAWSSSTN